MAALASFLEQLFDNGRIVLRDPPEDHPSSRALALLEDAYERHRLDVAGPPLDFDGPSALAASRFLFQACWFLVRRDQPVEVMEHCLVLPPGGSPAQHLSVDLVLRLLPQVHRRALALDTADRLPALLAEQLRRWPLSGVLSAVEEGPLTALDFGGHAGLLMLYAERWANRRKPAWLPRGVGREVVELVWRELGRDPAAMPACTGGETDG